VRQVGLLLDEVDDVEIYHFCAHAMVNLTVLENVRAYLDDQVRDCFEGTELFSALLHPRSCKAYIRQQQQLLC
jgi:hypothetical protein